jgi:signal transduction histidine kinase
MKTSSAKKPSSTPGVVGEANPYSVMARFLVETTRVQSVCELTRVIIESLHLMVPLSYVCLFLRHGSSKFILEGESEELLKEAGIFQIPADSLEQFPQWPCFLAELLPFHFGRAISLQVQKYKQVRCALVGVTDHAKALLCFKPSNAILGKDAEDSLELAIIQIGITLDRLARGFKIIGDALSQPDEIVKWKKAILCSERQSCMAEMALAIVDGIGNSITIIGGLLRRISERDECENPHREYFSILFKELEKLERTVRDLEGFAHKRGSVLETVDINQLIKRSVEAVKERFIGSRPIDFKLYLGEHPCYTKMAENLIGAALTHLILNAAEATDKDDMVTIIVKPTMDRNIIEIQDHGEGIPSRMLSRVFDPFYSTKPGGAGLGLTYARQIINEHGGELSVWSLPGRGTKFSVFLPKHDAFLERQQSKEVI